MNDSRYSLHKEEDGVLNSNGPYSPVMVEDVHINHASKSKRSRIFALIIILLLVTCAVLIVLYTMERGKRKDAEQTVQEEKSISPKKVCTTDHCVRTASEIMKNLNKDVDPCEDFYSFACGGWQREHPIPDTESEWNQVEELKQRNRNTLRRLLDSKQTRDKYSKISAVQKVYEYYDACTNEKAIENAGIKPLIDTIAKYGSWNITKTGFKGPWDFYTYLTSIHRELDIAPLFKISVDPDIKNSSIHRIMIKQTSHFVTLKGYLSNETHSQKVASAYKQLMKEIAKLLGANIEESAYELQEIFDLEKSLSKISLPKEEMGNEIKIYNLLTIKELTKRTKNELDWLRILNEIFKDVGVSFKIDDQVVVLGMDYIENLGLLLRQTPKRVLRNYMIWQIVVNFALELGSIAQPSYDRYKSVADGTISGTISPWKVCIDEMSKNKLLGYPLGLIFIDEKFRKESLHEISKVIQDLREVFLSNLNELDWMDEQTKEKAREKANAIRENIGYPSYLKDQEELDRRYKELKTNSSYFTSMVNLRRFVVFKKLSKVNKPVDKKRWIIPPQRVNAYYYRVTNKITFPAGFLQPPFFDKNFPRAVSYGGIGIVVAHEITHGFDSNGRKYDKMGDLSNWWTNSSNDAFERKSKCFIEQYSNVRAYGMNLNGVQTLGENIADNAAIKHAFMAYQHWVQNHREEPNLPGMEYTNDQVFFISAGQVDCSNTRTQNAKNAIEQGTHTLSKFRVNLEMANSKEFSKAFNCPLGSPMNPEKKCEVW